MEIDRRKFRNSIIKVMTGFKQLETELLAHRLLVHALNFQYSDVEETLEVARNSVQVQEMMRQKYDVPLEAVLKRFDESSPGQDLFGWIQEWKPSGPID